jgi:hypothetical protein
MKDLCPLQWPQRECHGWAFKQSKLPHQSPEDCKEPYNSSTANWFKCGICPCGMHTCCAPPQCHFCSCQWTQVGVHMVCLEEVRGATKCWQVSCPISIFASASFPGLNYDQRLFPATRSPSVPRIYWIGVQNHAFTLLSRNPKSCIHAPGCCAGGLELQELRHRLSDANHIYQIRTSFTRRCAQVVYSWKDQWPLSWSRGNHQHWWAALRARRKKQVKMTELIRVFCGSMLHTPKGINGWLTMYRSSAKYWTILQYLPLVFIIFEVLEGPPPIHGGNELETANCN